VYEAIDRQFNDIGYFVDRIESVIKSFKPDCLITHGVHDVNTDHSILCKAALIAARLPQRQTGYTEKISCVLHMEVPSSTDWGIGFVPNYFLSLNKEDLYAKIEALKVYDGVLREQPHPRSEKSITALAQVRGSACGHEYAEAFELGWFAT
jgi:LmbE family N-acetylglucosaminyl deacetylase